MRATVMFEAGDVRIEGVPDAAIIEPTDAVVRVTRACICGSDLWPYNQMERTETGQPMGHEAVGVVEEVGDEVRDVKEGDVVVMPFAYSDGTCEFCREGLQTACVHAGFFGAEQVIILGRHADRIALAREFGVTDVVSERGQEAVERVRGLTGGYGAHSVLECVGHGESTETAINIARPGGAVGRVGVPQDETMPASQPAFFGNVTVGGGPAPVRAYIGELLPDVLEGRIEPGRVLDRVVGLDGVPDGYRAMNDRESIKVMVRP
jgi:threonine dehydrogenase-like Zn-dependent dehydrogenase